MNEKIQMIKEKTYLKLSNDERTLVDSIIVTFKLTLDQKNIIFLSFLFGESINTAFKKIIGGN